MTGDRYAVLQLGDEGFTPLRLRLGIEAFGVTVPRAGAGEQLVSKHSEEGEDGNEEHEAARAAYRSALDEAPDSAILGTTWAAARR